MGKITRENKLSSVDQKKFYLSFAETSIPPRKTYGDSFKTQILWNVKQYKVKY